MCDGMEGGIDKAVVDDGDASHLRSAPQPGVSCTDTATGREAGTEPGHSQATESEAGTVLGHTQAEVRKGGGVTRGKGGVGTPISIRGCKHDRKGFCFTHEMVATKKYREIPCLKAGPGGQKVETTTKKHYFECEVGPSGRGVLRQTVLQFALVSPSITTLTDWWRSGRGGWRYGQQF